MAGGERMTQVFIPTNTFANSEHRDYLKELLMVPYDDLSPREKARIDKACDDGDIYTAEYVVSAAGQHIISTDTGAGVGPDHTVEVRLPKWVPVEKVLFAIARVVEDIL
jgi:hypothetical protein